MSTTMATPDTYTEDNYRDLYADQSEPPKEVSRTQQLLNNLYATHAPTPTPNTDKLDRISRMGRINMIGQAAGVLGDMFTVSQGGNVKRRGPDTTASALYQSYQNTLDRNKAENDLYKQRDYETGRQNQIMGIHQSMAADQAAARAASEKAKMDWEHTKFGLNYTQKGGQFTETQSGKDADRVSRENIAKRHDAVGWDRNKIASEKTDKTVNKPFKPIEVFDDYGVKVQRSQAEWSKDFQEAQNDPTFTKDHLQALLSNYEKMPDGGRQQIAADYYNYKQQIRLQERAKAANSGVMINPQFNPAMQPSTPTMQQPKVAKQTKISDILNDPELKGLVKVRK